MRKKQSKRKTNELTLSETKARNILFNLDELLASKIASQLVNQDELKKGSKSIKATKKKISKVTNKKKNLNNLFSVLIEVAKQDIDK